jgi:hypothetical protein
LRGPEEEEIKNDGMAGVIGLINRRYGGNQGPNVGEFGPGNQPAYVTPEPPRA